MGTALTAVSFGDGRCNVVRFGSFSDFGLRNRDVGFTPNIGQPKQEEEEDKSL
jgi:hypothetical protein